MSLLSPSAWTLMPASRIGGEVLLQRLLHSGTRNTDRTRTRHRHPHLARLSCATNTPTMA